MSAKIFYRKSGWIAFILSFCIVASGVAYALIIARVKQVELEGSFYFLVSEEVHVQASAEFIKMEGGAGYLLDLEGKEYVALSVYLKEEEGRTVQANLANAGKSTKLLSSQNKRLYFRGEDRKDANMYVSALRIFREYISFLSECISRLEKGLTQEKCKGLLGILERQYAYAGKGYAEYASFAKVCKQSQSELEKLREQTVFLRDLRYLLCWQVEEYGRLCGVFG